MNLIDLKFGHNLIMQSNRTYINYNFYFFICYVHYNGLYLSFKDDDFMFLLFAISLPLPGKLRLLCPKSPQRNGSNMLELHFLLIIGLHYPWPRGSLQILS